MDTLHVVPCLEITINNASCKFAVYTLSPIIPVSVVLQPLTSARRHVIRPAARWGGASNKPIQVKVKSGVASAAPTAVPDSVPSTSRDAMASSTAVRPAVRLQIPLQPSTSGHTPPQPGSSTYTQSQPKPNTNSQKQDGTVAHKIEEPLAVTSIQTLSTSTVAKPNAVTSATPVLVHLQFQPSTSGRTQPRAGTSAHLVMELQASTSTTAAHCSRAATSTHVGDSTETQGMARRTQPQPGTSTQLQSSGTKAPQTHLIQVRNLKLIALPQQPSIQASALISQPQLQLRPQAVLQNGAPYHTQGNLIQIEPQPLAQAPAQAAQAPQVTPVIPPAVLIAAAPERLGPPEAGHRIILGSQALGNNPQPQAVAPGADPHALGHNTRVPNANVNPPAPPAPPAPTGLALAPNLERVNPAPGQVAVPPAPEEIPRIEDARPGPSVTRERPEQQPHIRALITGVVSIKQTKL